MTVLTCPGVPYPYWHHVCKTLCRIKLCKIPTFGFVVAPASSLCGSADWHGNPRCAHNNYSTDRVPVPEQRGFRCYNESENGSCKVNTGSSDSVFILDPCNCTTYYKLISSPVVTKERLSCESSQLWNHRDDECQPRNYVLKNKLCNERVPWDRCFAISESDKIRIENNCVRDGFYRPSTGDAFFVNNIHRHLLTRESQLANIELVFASLVAGSVITVMLIALLMALCDWKYFSNIKLPTFLSRPVRRKSTKPQNITEGDNVSVLYEDVDENEEDTLNSGYKPMSTSEEWQSTSSSSRTTTSTGKEQTSSTTNTHIVLPRRQPAPPPDARPKPASRRPLAPPEARSKPASIQVEVSTHNIKKLKVTPKPSANYIHPK